MPNKKNKGRPPKLTDERLEYVPVSCGKCIECRKRKQREWIARLSEEIRVNKGIFVTLTISNKSFYELREKKEETENDICTRAMRRFLERIRKETGKSVKHWAVTELVGEGGRIHMHGIFFCKKELIEKHWKYGYTWIGDWVNEQTVFYITKYMLKVNENDKSFIGKVLCSAGIGANYINRKDAQNNKFVPHGTEETYKLRNGKVINLPQYYRRKIYTEEEREKLWIEKQEQEFRFIMGEKVDIYNEDEYKSILEYYQRMGRELYGDNVQEWEYQAQRNRLERMKKARSKAVEKVFINERKRLKNLLKSFG